MSTSRCVTCGHDGTGTHADSAAHYVAIIAEHWRDLPTKANRMWVLEAVAHYRAQVDETPGAEGVPTLNPADRERR